jgi:hypothetical protein
VYDKGTGLLLELKETQGKSDTSLSYGFSVVEENIFETTDAPLDEAEMRFEYAYFGIVVIILVAKVVCLTFLRKRARRHLNR